VVDQRAIFRNHRHDIVDSGTGGGVYTMVAARSDLMVDRMVRRSIRLDSNGHFTILLPLTLNFLLDILKHTLIHKLCDSK